MIKQVQAIEFIIRGNVNEMYDDNINTSQDDPETDWITNIMLGAAIRSEGRTRELELAGNIYQSYHLRNEEANEFYQDLVLEINKSLTENISVMLGDTLHHYPAAQSFDAMFERSETEDGYLRNDFFSGITLYVTRSLFLGGTYNNSILKNDSDLVLDSVLHNPGGVIGYYFNSANIIRAGYMYRLMKYDDSTEARGETGYAEYEKHFTSQLRAIAHGGYDYNTMEEGRSLSTSWLLSLIDDVDERNQINITFMKGSTISNISNDTLNNWRVSGTLTREVGNRTSADITIFYGDGTYEVSRERDRLGGASFGLSYVLSDFINLNAGYTFTWSSIKHPDTDEVSYKRNQVYAGISGEY